MRRIAFIARRLEARGAERMIVRLASALRGFEPVIVLFENHVDYPAAVRVVPPGPDANLPGYESLEAALPMNARLGDVLASIDPAVVVTMTSVCNVRLAAERMLGRLPWPHVAVEVTVPSRGVACCYPAPLVEAAKRLMRAAFPATDRVVACSQAARSSLARDFGVASSVIPNAVDVAAVRRLASERPDHPWFSNGRPVVVSMGRMTYPKNQALTLRAVATLPGVRLAFLSDGPDRPALQSLSRELGMSNRTAFLGHVENPFAFVARATAFALSSDFEGLPLGVLEAMACGAPVAATAAGGTPEVVRDGVNGLLSPVGDAPALADSLRKLLDGPTRERLARTAASDVAAFDLPRVAAAYERVFNELAA